MMSFLGCHHLSEENVREGLIWFGLGSSEASASGGLFCGRVDVDDC